MPTSNPTETAPAPADGRPKTSLGYSLFYCPTGGAHSIAGIRQRVELKFAACLATGGHHGNPVDIERIHDPRLRQLSACGMTCRNWSTADLVGCADELEGIAGSVLIATLDNPRWGQDDVALLGAIERLEYLESKAWRGGLLL